MEKDESSRSWHTITLLTATGVEFQRSVVRVPAGAVRLTIEGRKVSFSPDPASSGVFLEGISEQSGLITQ